METYFLFKPEYIDMIMSIVDKLISFPKARGTLPCLRQVKSYVHSFIPVDQCFDFITPKS